LDRAGRTQWKSSAKATFSPSSPTRHSGRSVSISRTLTTIADVTASAEGGHERRRFMMIERVCTCEIRIETVEMTLVSDSGCAWINQT